MYPLYEGKCMLTFPWLYGMLRGAMTRRQLPSPQMTAQLEVQYTY